MLLQENASMILNESLLVNMSNMGSLQTSACSGTSTPLSHSFSHEAVGLQLSTESSALAYRLLTLSIQLLQWLFVLMISHNRAAIGTLVELHRSYLVEVDTDDSWAVAPQEQATSRRSAEQVYVTIA